MKPQPSDLDDVCPNAGRHPNLRQKLFLLIMLGVGLIFLSTLSRTSITQAQGENSHYSRPIRTIEAQSVNLAQAAGLVYSPSANAFFTVNRANSNLNVETATSQLAIVSHRAQAAGSVGVGGVTGLPPVSIVSGPTGVSVSQNGNELEIRLTDAVPNQSEFVLQFGGQRMRFHHHWRRGGGRTASRSAASRSTSARGSRSMSRSTPPRPASCGRPA